MSNQTHEISDLAPFASNPAFSRGRLRPEPDSRTRNPFQRDRDRIIHCTAFRRLQHKTQVFIYLDGDHFRTRLTHSLEVSQIARSICRTFRLNEDLGEALALAHDLGHTPFGHAGEEELDRLMAEYNGFDHNAQTLRILTSLERRYAEFDGLNLTWETLEGAVKHNGPVLPTKEGEKLPIAIEEYARIHDLELHTHAGPEAQIAALADDIAYNNHDLDDGLRAELFTLDDLLDVPLVGPIIHEIRQQHGELDTQRVAYEAVRKMIGVMIDDLSRETSRRIAEVHPESVEDVRHLDHPLVAFSDEMQQADRDLKAFLFKNMYRHWRVNRMTVKARRVVRQLFELYMSEPTCLPPEWFERTDGPYGVKTARRVADFIAGMTDLYAMQEYRRLFDMDIRTL